MNLEHEEMIKSTFEKCRVYCDKINQLGNEIKPSDEEESDEQVIFKTLKNCIKEKKELKVQNKGIFLN